MNASPPRAGSNRSPSAGIAVVGIGCRLPGGVESPRDYWQLLCNGVDAISETPPERWNLQQFYFPDQVRRGKTQSRWGGYVTAIDRFDPQLFGISPKEAASMDPQQRMLLEVAWRAMEDAGLPFSQAAGRPVGVFVGISSFDYAVAGLSYVDRAVIGSYNNTGSSSSIAANRISYCFHFRGPSLAVDTACSSSLVALHLACESLLRGESEMALCGGVNALLLPDFYVGFSQLGVLSPDGRCKTFDARANGYVRSEGAGMVLLKPLELAIRDRDRIYCVIRGTATNQDGHTAGLTVPSGEAQEDLVRTACHRANVDPSAIQYVEAHGTGTPVGDPIEATALGNVLGSGRDAAHPLWIGSVKTNIGHLEAGAGIASLIKVALSLHHGLIPPHLNLESPNPEIDFERLRIAVPRQSVPWPRQDCRQSDWPHRDGTRGDQRRIAGINSFGYGGANAHAIVEEAPFDAARSGGTAINPGANAAAGSPSGQARIAKTEAALHLLPISARSLDGLSETARQYARFLLDEGAGVSMRAIAATAAHRRDHFEYRRAIVGGSLQDWAEQLSDLHDELKSQARTSASSFRADARQAGPMMFVCCGQGTQWWAMGRGLLETNSTYRAMIQRCDETFRKHVDWSLRDELLRDASESRMHKTSIAQPALFALQIALAQCWAELGVLPDVVVGHSVGEIAAAYLSGALCFEDACLVAIERGRTMDLATSCGAMIAVGLSESECEQWIHQSGLEVSIAAINGPTSATLSGRAEPIDALASALEQAGVFVRRLPVEYAFHSKQMEPVKEALLRALADLRPRPTEVDLISTVTGKRIEGGLLDAEYWWHNVRHSVRFADAITLASSEGHAIAVELGPHPTLTFAINECCQSIGQPVHVIPSLRRDAPDQRTFAQSVAQAYQLGVEIDWFGIYDKPPASVELPPHPFLRQRLWSESMESQRTRLADSHPLLGMRTEQPDPTWRGRIDLSLQQMFHDHRVRGNSVLPASAMIESALAAIGQLTGTRPITLQRFRFDRPALLDENRSLQLETRFDHSLHRLSLSTRVNQDPEWTPLASTEWLTDGNSIPKLAHSTDELRDRSPESFDASRLYAYCERLGLQYGAGFRGIRAGVRRSGEAFAEVELQSEESFQYSGGADPAVLDSCFHAMIAADPNFDHSVQGLFLPAEIERIQFCKPIPRTVMVHSRIVHKSEKRLLADLDIMDERGEPCVLIRGFLSKRVSGGAQDETIADWLYAYRWTPSEIADGGIVAVNASTQPVWIVLTDGVGLGASIATELRSRSERVIMVEHGSRLSQRSVDHFTIDPACPAHYDALLDRANASIPGQLVHWVYLWGLDAPTNSALCGESLERSTILTSLAPLYLVQSWCRRSEGRSGRMTVVTSGAQPQDDQLASISLAQTPLIGLSRVIISELAALRTRLVDVEADFAAKMPSVVSTLLRQLASEADPEDEVMYRDGIRYAHRFVPGYDLPLPIDAAEKLQSRLEIGESKGIDDLRYRSQPARDLRGDEVEIEVIASGLNFSDVMKALHLYPSDAELGPTLGAECAGRITRVGPDVVDWSVGDEVIAVAFGSFATHTIVSADMVAPKPSHLRFDQAAAIPIAFLTAAHALDDCARLRSGETVLVHAATGGVGLAAVQLARLRGARVFASAGSDRKRAHLLDHGVERVMDSRSLRFADDVREATGGDGVDVILNSLPGEAISRGVASLRVGGRFLEIGKRDIYDGRPLSMYPLRNNIAFFAIDLDQLFKVRPREMGGKLREISERFQRGELEPLPVSTWEVDQTDAAFRFMQQAKHIGKVVVRYDHRPRHVQAGNHGSIRFSGDATYWIIGGLGGFGMAVARWLTDRGVRSLVLSGRTASLGPEATGAIAELESLGVTVRVMTADVTDPQAVEKVLDRIRQECPPLRGVFHAAMVLQDRLLVDLDRATLDRVMRPKVLGAWNLHRATADLDLDHFVLFSSLSSVFGHAGQANYSAANAFLDALAHHRRWMGRPACVINWGHLGDVGYLARNEALSDRLRRQGVLSFTLEQALKCLEHALRNGVIQTSVLRMDWSLWRGLGISGNVSPRFAHLIRQSAASEQEGVSADGLRHLDPSRRLELVEQMLGGKVGSLLGLPEDQLDRNRCLVELGLDSLMAVEMRNWIEANMEIPLPIGQLMRDTSLRDLVELVCHALAEESAGTFGEAAKNFENQSQAPSIEPGNLGASDARELLDALPQMSADEMTSLLAQLLRDQESVSDEQS